MTTSAPTAKEKAYAISLYLGLAPLLSRSRSGSPGSFLRYHQCNALAVFGLFLAIIFLGVLGSVLYTYWLIYHFSSYQALHAEFLGRSLLAILLAICSFIWLLSVNHARSGQMKPVPLASRMCHNETALKTIRIGVLGAYCFAVSIAAISIHASSLTRRIGKPARAYMLYDDMGGVPRWVFCLGYYRIALAAFDRWGSGSVVVDELSHDSLTHAVEHGDFVFVASHGLDGYVLYGNVAIQPDDELAALAGPRLRMVYLTACDAGKNAQWKSMLAPSKVRVFDRPSAVVEHIAWLWLWGPSEFKDLEFGD